MLKKFCMGQNLRALFKPHKLPPELDELNTQWEHCFESDIRGTLISDSFTFDETFRQTEEEVTWEIHELKMLPNEWYLDLKAWVGVNDPDSHPLTLSPKAYIRQKISRLGETFRTEATSPADSHVYYRQQDGSTSVGSIQGIFSHTRIQKDDTFRTQTFFIINQYQPLPKDHRNCDNFRRFHTVAGKIYQDCYFSRYTLVNSDKLLHHFALGPIPLHGIEYPCFVALPLDKS